MALSSFFTRPWPCAFARDVTTVSSRSTTSARTSVLGRERGPCSAALAKRGTDGRRLGDAGTREVRLDLVQLRGAVLEGRQVRRLALGGVHGGEKRVDTLEQVRGDLASLKRELANACEGRGCVAHA